MLRQTHYSCFLVHYHYLEVVWPLGPEAAASNAWKTLEAHYGAGYIFEGAQQSEEGEAKVFM